MLIFSEIYAVQSIRTIYSSIGKKKCIFVIQNTITMRYFLFFICLLLSFHSDAQPFFDFEYKVGRTKCICDDTVSKQILSTVDTIKDERFLACCYHCIGDYYYFNYGDKYWTAIEYYKKALNIREQYQDDLLWKSYRNIAYSYKEAFHYERAIKTILKGFELSDKLKETRTYGYLGDSYMELGEFENAVEALENSVKLAKDDYELAVANNALCVALTRTKGSLNLLKALKHTEKAIELSKRENDTPGVAIAYLSKGNAHAELKQHEAAIQAYNQAKEIFSQENFPLYLAKTINNIATTRHAQGQHNEAIEQLKKSLKIKQEYHENAPSKTSLTISVTKTSTKIRNQATIVFMCTTK